MKVRAQEMSTGKTAHGPSVAGRMLFLLWAGFVAFAVPEIIAGSSAGWPFNAATYLLVIPLYASHFLLLTHLAIRLKRTSWPALYVLGIVFGLYETWITKVIWHGYPGSEGFAMGTIGPWFGVHETLGLVLFYHAVISFLVPLVIFSTLFPAFGAFFPRRDWLLAENRRGRIRRVGLVLILGTLSGFNMPGINIYLVSWLPALAIGFAGYGLLGRGFAEARPLLGRWSLRILLGILVLTYAVTYRGLLPENLPPAPAQWIALVLYALLFLLLRLLPARNASAGEAGPQRRGTPRRILALWLLSIFSVGLVESALMGAGGVVTQGATVAAMLAFAAMPAIGVGLFLWLPIWRGLIRRQRDEQAPLTLPLPPRDRETRRTGGSTGRHKRPGHAPVPRGFPVR